MATSTNILGNVWAMFLPKHSWAKEEFSKGAPWRTAGDRVVCGYLPGLRAESSADWHLNAITILSFNT